MAYWIEKIIKQCNSRPSTRWLFLMIPNCLFALNYRKQANSIFSHLMIIMNFQLHGKGIFGFWEQSHILQSKLCSSPMSPLGIVSDFVPRCHPGPLWDWTILFHLPCKHSLDLEGLVGRHVCLTGVPSKNDRSDAGFEPMTLSPGLRDLATHPSQPPENFVRKCFVKQKFKKLSRRDTVINDSISSVDWLKLKTLQYFKQ